MPTKPWRSLDEIEDEVLSSGWNTPEHDLPLLFQGAVLQALCMIGLLLVRVCRALEADGE